MAEPGAALLCAHLGVRGEVRHAGYIGHWREPLRHDAKAIFTAAAKASQAAVFLRAFSETAVTDPETPVQGVFSYAGPFV